MKRISGHDIPICVLPDGTTITPRTALTTMRIFDAADVARMVTYLENEFHYFVAILFKTDTDVSAL